MPPMTAWPWASWSALRPGMAWKISKVWRALASFAVEASAGGAGWAAARRTASNRVSEVRQRVVQGLEVCVRMGNKGG